jgi:hypothetical protein
VRAARHGGNNTSNNPKRISRDIKTGFWRGAKYPRRLPPAGRTRAFSAYLRLSRLCRDCAAQAFHTFQTFYIAISITYCHIAAFRDVPLERNGALIYCTGTALGRHRSMRSWPQDFAAGGVSHALCAWRSYRRPRRRQCLPPPFADQNAPEMMPHSCAP